MALLISSELKTSYGNALYNLSQALISIESSDANEASGSAYFNATYCYRALAIYGLLLNASASRYFVNLCKSGNLWHYFLRRVNQGHRSKPIYKCASLSLPFIDALVSGCMVTATKIASLSAREYNSTLEYEDDFLRYHFLQMFTLNLSTSANVDLGQILDRWEEVLAGGGRDLYFPVCRALYQNDSGYFFRSFPELLSHRAVEVDGWKEDFSFDPQVRIVESSIFMNGLAILRLAELLGMPTESEYEMIPSIARLPLGLTPPIEDSWKNPGE